MDPFTFAAHGVDLATAPRHTVAKCRWCGRGFVQVYGSQWLCETLACAQRQLDKAMPRKGVVFPGQSPWYYVPLPMQIEIEDVALARYKHSLIAGAAGTSKSYGSRHLLYSYCQRIAGLRCLMLRKTLVQLEQNHTQYMGSEQHEVGASWKAAPLNRMVFPHTDGPESIMFMGYCNHESQIAQHVGPEYDLILIEEAAEWIPRAVSEIVARARGSITAVDAKVRLGLPPRWSRSIVNTNPGGRAMMFLIDHYIRKTPDLKRFPRYDASQFGWLSSTLDDNPYLDELYEAQNLSHLEASRYRQLRHGDWTAVAGQFFPFTDAHLVG